MAEGQWTRRWVCWWVLVLAATQSAGRGVDEDDIGGSGLCDIDVQCIDIDGESCTRRVEGCKHSDFPFVGSFEHRHSFANAARYVAPLPSRTAPGAALSGTDSVKEGARGPCDEIIVEGLEFGHIHEACMGRYRLLKDGSSVRGRGGGGGSSTRRSGGGRQDSSRAMTDGGEVGLVYRHIEGRYFLYAYTFGQWVIGETAGCVEGMLVVLDKADAPHYITSTWHSFTGSRWVEAAGVEVTCMQDGRSGKSSKSRRKSRESRKKQSRRDDKGFDKDDEDGSTGTSDGKGHERQDSSRVSSDPLKKRSNEDNESNGGDVGGGGEAVRKGRRKEIHPDYNDNSGGVKSRGDSSGGQRSGRIEGDGDDKTQRDEGEINRKENRDGEHMTGGSREKKDKKVAAATTTKDTKQRTKKSKSTAKAPCSTFRLAGLAPGDLQHEMTGEYRLEVSTENNGRPVFRQIGGDHFVFNLDSDGMGVWVAGREIGKDDVGMVVWDLASHPSKISLPWKVWNTKEWIEDRRVTLVCLEDASEGEADDDDDEDGDDDDDHENGEGVGP